jgi:tripartite-type tricarboxylate transporter receptor subunit TctC
VIRINGAVAKVVNAPEFRERLKAEGSEPAVGTPEAYAAFLAEETAKWRKVIAAAGIKPGSE